MDVDTNTLVTVFDRIGIIAFAVSGVEVGIRRRLDVFGLMVMGIVTATGGGITRDLLLTRLPLAIDRVDYFLWAAGAAIAAILLFSMNRRLPFILVSSADAIGLGAFAAAGALAAIEFDLGIVPAILLAIVTGTGGGVIRDLLADRIPLVLRSEVNATAAAAGGATVWLIEPINIGLAALVGSILAALLRIGGLAFDYNLPVLKPPPPRRPR